ncbi:hypothetical protein [Pseudomonas nitroreducens]|nr:hypothetical protein [Pseudomonas nitritireducens]
MQRTPSPATAGIYLALHVAVVVLNLLLLNIAFKGGELQGLFYYAAGVLGFPAGWLLIQALHEALAWAKAS